MNLRVAHVTATFPPYHGGTGNVCYHNARELARLGHTVHVFTATCRGAPKIEHQEGFVTHRLRPLVQIGNAPVLPSLLTSLAGFDIIHLHYPFILGAELVRLAAYLNHTPLVVTFHNDLVGKGTRSPIFRIYQRLSAHLTIQTATLLCTISRDYYEYSRLRSSMTQQSPAIVELPNGVDIAHFNPEAEGETIRARYAIPSDDRVVLFVAALDRAHHFKGLDRLFRALTALPPNIHLLIVGEGELRSTYAAQAAHLGLDKRVTFAGRVADELIPAFYRSADVTVLPSSPPESFGLVLVESLACGTPVIASDIPGVRTVVDHGGDGLLFKHTSILALSQALKRILDDATMRREMGRQGRARVEERYAWESIGARLETFYLQLLGASETPISRYAGGH
ncbi:MAG: glycosyltransferase family 4 protein [Chloroflexales bacterium]|nr:glycosyltransferase family 4 protein [Chloroflexales bacterium]